MRLSERVEREKAGGSGQAPPGNGERTMRRLRTTEHPRKALRTGTLILLIVAGLQASCSDDQSPRQDHPNPPDVPAVGRPLFRDEFTEVAPQGFGDRQNTKAWSMKWWKDQLHVGTARAHTCVQDASLAFRIGGIFQYPREDPDLECTESPQDLPLQAEIWNLSPATEVWERVYQSPQDLEIPDHPGKVVARDIGLRGMVLFGNPEDGTEELYVGGVSSELINPDIGPPRMLHSEDGIHFEPIPQDPGTVMGDLGFKQGNMRSMATVDGRLFVVIGESRGDGDLYEATDPAGGNNNFRIVSPPRMKIYEMCLYNGTLYLGLTQDESKEGYFVVKTDAQGDLPYKFTVVVPNGGYLTPYPSNTVVSMCVFQDRLYVGTDKPAELIRINPDDTWDLLVGAARETPEGWKEPLSGMTAGFNWALNEHIWQMAVHEGWLYIGTNDLTSLNMKNWSFMRLPELGKLLKAFQGYDLVATHDGVHYTIIDRAGFGDGLEVGIRTFASTPFGLFFGTSNPYYGLRIWRGNYNRAPDEPDPPQALEVETKEGATLLCWDDVGGAERFHVFRTPGVDPFEEIGFTEKLCFRDDSLQASYNTYYVTAEALDRPVSRPSNTCFVPSRVAATTFAGVHEQLVGYEQEGKYASAGAEAWLLGRLSAAQKDLDEGRAEDAEALLLGLKAKADVNEGSVKGTRLLEEYCAEDMGISLGRLIKRIRLVRSGFLTPEDLR
jgi:hypothetical protein